MRQYGGIRELAAWLGRQQQVLTNRRTVMALVGPPEGVLPQDLVLLELRPQPPALVISQRMPVFLQDNRQTQWMTF